MHQLLLIDQDKEFSKVVKLNLMKTYDFNVIEKDDVSGAIDLLEILPDISLIIVREKNAKPRDLINFLTVNKRPLPVILIGAEEYNYEKLVSVGDGDGWQSVVAETGKMLGFDPMEDFKNSVNDFVPVPLSYFFGITETGHGCDVYIRVKKNEKDFQYIKRLLSTDSFNRDEIEKYQKQGLKEFFIAREHFPGFVNHVTKSLTKKLDDTALESKDKMVAASSAYEITAERIQSIGIDDETMKIAHQSVKAMQANLASKNALSEFLNLMMSNKLSYSYAHSFLISLLMVKVIRQFDWDSPAVRDKISYIAFFHDISLKDEALTSIDTEEELNRRVELDHEQKILILQHARKSAEIVNQFKEVPMGVGMLIQEHHGVKNGMGFTSSFPNTLSPISMIFIVVETFTSQFLKIQGTPNRNQLEQIIKNLNEVFPKGGYAQAVAALQKMVLPPQ